MLFRFTGPEPVSVTTLTGHGARVGNEWRELPEVLHEAAIKAGCERSDQPPITVAKVIPSPGVPTDYDSAYRQALTTMLERSQEGDFTRDSLPNINVVSSLAGIKANKEDVLRVFRAMKSEAGVGAEAA